MRVAYLLLAATARAAIDADEITSLPGWEGALPTRQWSGYLEVPATDAATNRTCRAFVHYWLVENAAGRADAPTVVWQQGGPGGSSLIGLLTENGPLTLNDFSFATDAYNATGVPTVFENAASWHRAPANVLYVEHPAPTGFSYCLAAGANDTAVECAWDDTTQAAAALAFYVAFFAEVRGVPSLSLSLGDEA